jgi:hypothetical protein
MNLQQPEMIRLFSQRGQMAHQLSSSLCVLCTVQELADLLKNPRTQRRWGDIITLDPLGMFAGRPTQSATSANMSIPELQLGTEMVADGVIVSKEDRTIACVKVAVDLVWSAQESSLGN